VARYWFDRGDYDRTAESLAGMPVVQGFGERDAVQPGQLGKQEPAQ
jgi:hypothetical protein